MIGHLNLSRRPFINTRPVTRVALLLWILGALLLLGNVTLFWNYLSGSTEKRAELDRLEQQIEHEREAAARLQTRLAGLDLGDQNEQVEYLNRKIAERTFSWSLLFDRLTETMPDGVRVIQIRPAAIGGDERPRARTAGRREPAPLASDRVQLLVQAEAKSDEDLNQFIDNLFAHPAFDEPNFPNESRSEENENRIQFTLEVQYLPRNATPDMTVEESPEVVEEETPPATPAPESPGDPEGTETGESETE